MTSNDRLFNGSAVWYDTIAFTDQSRYNTDDIPKMLKINTRKARYCVYFVNFKSDLFLSLTVLIYMQYGVLLNGNSTSFMDIYLEATFSILNFRTQWSSSRFSWKCELSMMTSPNGNIFRVTGPVWGEFAGHRWIPLTKAGDAELWCFLWSAPEQTVEQIIDTPVTWDVNALIMTSL